MDLDLQDAEELATRQTLAEAIAADPVAAYAFNPGQVRFFNLICESPATGKEGPAETITIVEFLKGNGSGGSWALVAALSALMFGTDSPHFQRAPFGGRWPFKKRSVRLVTTSESLKDTGPIQTAMRFLFPAGRWTQSRGVGKQYYSEGRTIPREGTLDPVWTWDFMTYNQSVTEFASANKDLILFSEPPPEPIFQETVTRLRGQGMVWIDMTQLDMAQFNQALLDDGLTINGKPVGEVRHTYMDHHEACADHFEGGHRPHEAIEADYALWLRQDPTIAEARKSGKALRLSGLIYPNWGPANEWDRLPEWHQKCWDAGHVRIGPVSDPHDRKPWAVNWFATFPNNDVVAFAEWPTFRFHEVKVSPLSDIEAYRAMFLDTEADVGRAMNFRLMDPRFGAAAKTGEGRSPQQMMNDACRACKERHKDKALEACPHRLYFSLPPYNEIHHAPLRGLIGNAAEGIRPKFYALKEFCPNLCYGMRHYAWKENKDPAKGLSETAELVHKDFPDLPRYLVDAGMHIYPEPVRDLKELNLAVRARTAMRARK